MHDVSHDQSSQRLGDAIQSRISQTRVGMSYLGLITGLDEEFASDLGVAASGKHSYP